MHAGTTWKLTVKLFGEKCKVISQASLLSKKTTDGGTTDIKDETDENSKSDSGTRTFSVALKGVTYENLPKRDLKEEFQGMSMAKRRSLRLQELVASRSSKRQLLQDLGKSPSKSAKLGLPPDDVDSPISVQVLVEKDVPAVEISNCLVKLGDVAGEMEAMLERFKTIAKAWDSHLKTVEDTTADGMNLMADQAVKEPEIMETLPYL